MKLGNRVIIISDDTDYFNNMEGRLVEDWKEEGRLGIYFKKLNRVVLIKEENVKHL